MISTLRSINEIAYIISGGTPKTTVREYWDGKIPWLSVKDFNRDSKYVYSAEKSITELGLNQSAANLLQHEDIIISARGTVGLIAKISQPMAFNQSCFGIRSKGEVDQDYLYYAMKYSVASLKLLTQGSVFSTINRATFDKWKIPVPTINVQREISIILSSIDKKLAVNNQLNDYLAKYLKSYAKWLYREYERDEGADLPEGWRRTTIGEISEMVCRGITPKYNDESDELILGQTCIRDNLVLLENGRLHALKKITEKWLKKYDLLINSTGVGSLGRTAQVWFDPLKLVVDSHVTIVRAADPRHALYMGFWVFEHERYIESLHTGSTGQTELPRDHVKAIRLVLPSDVELEKFNAVAQPVVELIVANQEESKRLAELRDTLLPKLMSDEIDVSSVAI